MFLSNVLAQLIFFMSDLMSLLLTNVLFIKYSISLKHFTQSVYLLNLNFVHQI